MRLKVFVILTVSVLVGGIALFFMVSSRPLQVPEWECIERCESSQKIYEDLIQDYYWWNRKLPSSPLELQSYVEQFPKEWQPLPGSSVEFKPGSVSKQKSLRVVISFKDVCNVEREFSLREKRQYDSYSPHYTFMQDGRFGKLANTDENTAVAIAWAICELIYNQGVTPKDLDDLQTSSIGRSLDDLRIGRSISFLVKQKEIVVTLNGRAFRYLRKMPDF